MVLPGHDLQDPSDAELFQFINFLEPDAVVEDDSSPDTLGSGGFLTPESSPCTQVDLSAEAHSGSCYESAQPPTHTRPFSDEDLHFSTSTTYPSEYGHVTVHITPHQETTATNRNDPIGGLDVNHNQDYSHLPCSKRSASSYAHDAVVGHLDTPQFLPEAHDHSFEATEFLQVCAQPISFVTQQRLGGGYDPSSGARWNNSLLFGGTNAAHHTIERAAESSVSLTTASSGSQSLVSLGLPISNVYEQPWSQYSVHQEVHSQSAAVRASSFRPTYHEASSRRIAQNGAVQKARAPQKLVPKEPSSTRANPPSSSSASPASAADLNTGITRHAYGGRQGPLRSHSRGNASLLRKVHACWRCALQRVHCDADAICRTCAERFTKHPTERLGCDRHLLHELSDVFLPASLTRMHNLKVVSVVLERSIVSWASNGVTSSLTVDFTIGYGPRFSMELNEYMPFSQEVALQLQWEKMSITDADAVQCIKIASPPLAIKSFGQNDVDQHQRRLERLIDSLIDYYLDDFRETYCSEQEDDPFRAGLLVLLCKLYTSIPDDHGDITLRADLKAALRSIMATDMMLHPVTMDDRSRNEVIAKMLNRDYNDPTLYGSDTSPKLLNRQFKSLIANIQEAYIKDVLRRLHMILRMNKASKKQKTWLSSFILMLAIALCQEEIEHIRYLRADGDYHRGDRSQATYKRTIADAQRDCSNADEGFDFLMTLFNHKYSPQKRYIANLQHWVKKYNNLAERDFLVGLIGLVKPYQVYLMQRKDGKTTSARDRRYKSRLVSRFLVSFMSVGLPMDHNSLFGIPLNTI